VLSARDSGSHPWLFEKIAEEICRDRYGPDFPLHSTLRPNGPAQDQRQTTITAMPKKKSKVSVTAATHRLTLEIAKPQATVWRAFTAQINSWWPKDFYVTESPRGMVFEVKPGGRLYEDAGNGNGLVWYHVIALDAPNAITLSGFIAPPFGGPATSLLRVAFSAQDKSTTAMEVVDSTFGYLEDTSTTEQGWRMVFEGGFKTWIERKR
jgi:uncharacterized protein YndB with AHSA1/START domain